MPRAPTKTEIESLVSEALQILEALGIAFNGLSVRRKTKMAKAFLAVAGLKPDSTWADAKSNDDGHRLRSREIIKWMNAHLGEKIADGSYDDIRRKDLLLPVAAHIVMKASEHAGAKTNDGTRAYALHPAYANVIRKFGTSRWNVELTALNANKKTLIESIMRARGLTRVPIRIGSEEFSLSPGDHNLVQKAVVENFLPLFGQGAEVLYLGDTENKNLFHDEKELLRLGFFELAHDKLPDVVAYSKRKNWLFLIEAVDTSNPITEMRKATFDEITAGCKADIVYVTAFINRASFRKFSKDIAWETEVWVADNPEHMIHFNGDKFLGPYAKRQK